MFQQSFMASGRFLDERHGLDWLLNAVEVDSFNTLYTNSTKIPYTAKGVARLEASVAKSLDQAVVNGFAAAGYYTDPETGEQEFLPLVPNTPNTCLLYTSPSPRD